MPESIRFLLGNELQELSGFDPQMTVLEWLRTRVRRTGTKEGCAEGDCGACTVALGEVVDGAMRYRAFNSCIQLLPTLDGKQLVTVEDLAVQDASGESLHPVQQAMVDQHGSQCGFCTPGFVMSLFTLFHQPAIQATNGPALDRQRIDEALAGNLCRCTGYAPIVRAVVQAMEQAPVDQFSNRQEELVAKLQPLQRDSMLQLEFQGRRFFAPRTLAEVWELLRLYPAAQLVAGATDVGLWMTKQLRVFDTVISLCQVSELPRIERDEAAGTIAIGAAVTYTDALATLVSAFPEMRRMLSRLGAVQVRNAGTMGGNIANGSPVGDMPPALIALGARLLLSSSAGRREIPLEDYFIEYGKQDLQPGECVEAVVLPLPVAGQHYAVYKLSKRFDQDVSAVCAAFCIRLQDGKVIDARICFGGMAGTPLRARSTEQVLLGQPWNDETLPQVMTRARAALAEDYSPLSDWRASREYRLLAAQNLLRRFFLETTSTEPAQLCGPGQAGTRA
ncbi:MAG: xanthine dehydrogenase small subunit [Xanthomonadales bacterium]|nr:xanthine dehydrogenase small subunit [Xanthomonadales bacterium]